MKRRRLTPTIVNTVRKCSKCGDTTTKRFCDSCIETRFGVIVQRDYCHMENLQHWLVIGDGCIQRTNPYKGRSI